MALGGGGVRIPIDVDPAGAIRGIKTTERHLDGLSRSGLKSMNLLKSAGLGAAAAVGTGLAIAIGTGVREMLEFEKVAARTANVIESTGGKAGITAKHVEELANRLQELTGTEDDVIQAGENVLLTFTRIGAKGGIFDRATAAANDLSVAMGTDIEGAARKLGRALQDPEKGLGGLSRAGIQFNNDQRKAIKTWLEHGEVVRAQAFILREVEKRFEGAARSEGRTTEAVQRAQRTFEEFTQTVVAKALPALASIIEWARRNWPLFQRIFNEHVGPLIQRLRTIGEVVADVARAVQAVMRGDWSAAWRFARRAVVNFAGQIIEDLLRIPRRVLAIGRDIASALGRGIRDAASAIYERAKQLGRDLARGILDGIRDAATGLPGTIVDFLFPGGTGGPSTLVPDIRAAGRAAARQPRRAMGGTVPGRDGQAVPILAHAGEVVLNERQQRMLGERRIMDVLRRTGGVIGGPGSAMKTGGVLGPAIDFARAQVGEPYQWGAGHAFGDFSSWDCSGFASNVAARIPGYTGGIGTTYTLAPKSSPARGNEPVVFGFRPGHMGIRVAGTWYDAGSGGVEVGDSRWDSLKVPPGLAYLSGLDPQRAIASGDGPDPGPRLAPDKPTPLQALTKVLGATGVFGKAAGTLARAILKPVPDVSAGLSSSLSPAQERAVARSGRQAAAGQMAAGHSPEQVREAQEDAQREGEKFFLRKNKKKVIRTRDKLIEQRNQFERQYEKLAHSRPQGRAAREARIKAMKALRRKIRALNREINDVRGVIAEIEERLQEIGAEELMEAHEEAYAAGAEAAAAVSAGEGAAAAPEAGISADAQAQIDQATERARVAARGQAISDSFIRTLFGSGSIDPRAGAVTVNINTLHPGDPALQGEIASWIVGVLGGQGSVPASAFGVGL